jgi:hypothetical protein
MAEAANEKTSRFFLLGEPEFSERILQDENLPVFYNPKLVVQIARWMYVSSRVAVVVVILSSLQKISNAKLMVGYLFNAVQLGGILSWMIAGAIVLCSLALQFFLYFFGLRTAAHLLVILMEMEYNSRGGSR